MSRATDRRNQEDALRAAIDTHNRCVDLIYASAIGACRIAGLETEDVPRLCISAGCQTIEKLIDKYQRVLAGQLEMSPTDRATLRATIVGAATDLVAALDTARKAAEAFASYAEREGTPQGETPKKPDPGVM